MPALERNSNSREIPDRRQGGGLTQPGVKLTRSLRVEASRKTQEVFIALKLEWHG